MGVLFFFFPFLTNLEIPKVHIVIHFREDMVMQCRQYACLQDSLQKSNALIQTNQFLICKLMPLDE